jgi:cytochrome c-type biogenesis protein CcmH
MKKRRSLLIFLAVAAIVGSIWSYVFLVTPRQQTLDQRVYDVASQLKCLVCQGESVADSPATLSQQMRGIIRQQLQSGQSEQEVIQYFESRYGDRILWSPPWQGFTLLAWLVPIALLLGGTLLLFIVLRDWQTRSAKGLTEENGRTELEDIEEKDMEYYRQQLEQELAAEDSIFAHRGTEAD